MTSDMKNTFANKNDFRQFCLKKLAKSANYGKIKKNAIVLKKLEKVLEKVTFRDILFYIPLKNEVNLLKFLQRTKKNHKVFVPFMEGVSFKLVKYRLPLKKKKFSIYEPPNSNMNFCFLDVAIVPVVGVDGELKRVGFGKGMYDRFFKSLKRRPLVIFVQLDFCCTKSLIGDVHDIQADIYITPQYTLIRRGINDNIGIRSSNGRSSRSKCRGRVFCCKKDK